MNSEKKLIGKKATFPDKYVRECIHNSKDKPFIEKMYPFTYKFCSQKCLDDVMGMIKN